jgi:hypothetical protein
MKAAAFPGLPVRRLGLALVALLAVLPASAMGFGKLRSQSGVPAAWDLTGSRLAVAGVNTAAGRIRYVVDLAGCGSISDGSEFTAVQNAFDTWEAVPTCTAAFERLADAAVSIRYDDGTNAVKWNAGTVAPGVYAQTYTTYYDAGDHEGIILDADIEINDDISWATTTPGTLGAADVQDILTHEIGHFLGLDHSPLGTSTLYATTWTGAIRGRTLEADDIAGISSSYPDPSFATATASLQGIVHRAGSPVFGAWVVAVDAEDQAVSVGGITGTGGGYAVRGLGPGSYWLLVFPADPSNLSHYYQAADTGITPRIWPDVLGPAASRTFTVGPGGVQTAHFQVDPVTTPLEPDGSTAQASSMAYGQWAAAAVESAGDSDYFRFDGAAGDDVVAGVIAFGAGSDLNPRLRLYDASGVNVVASSDDIVPPTPANITGLPGPDLDARINGAILPSDGPYYLRVSTSFTGPSAGYYFLYLFNQTAVSVPDAGLSDVGVAPSVIDADGASRARVTVIPKNGLGQPLGSGCSVSVNLSGPGTVSAVTDEGDGTYSAFVTAPLLPGTATVEATADAGGSGQISLTQRPVLTYREVEEEGCGCARSAGSGPASALGLVFPWMVLGSIIVAVRVVRTRRRRMEDAAG